MIIMKSIKVSLTTTTISREKDPDVFARFASLDLEDTLVAVRVTIAATNRWKLKCTQAVAATLGEPIDTKLTYVGRWTLVTITGICKRNGKNMNILHDNIFLRNTITTKIWKREKYNHHMII